jgi:hypothetical protein
MSYPQVTSFPAIVADSPNEELHNLYSLKNKGRGDQKMGEGM